MATHYRPRSRRLGILLVLSLCSASALSASHTRYRAVEIGAPGGVLSYANSVNDVDEVVGDIQYADGHTQAFLWDEIGGIRRVQRGTAASTAQCINNKGQIAGASTDSDGFVNAVVWSPALLPTIVASAPFGAVASFINDKGQAVGFREDGVFSIFSQAFLWPALAPNSAFTDLFSSDLNSFATCINTRGEIVGSVERQAFLRQPNGTVLFLAGNPNLGPAANAVAVNDKGAVLVSQAGTAFLMTQHSTERILAPTAVIPNALNQSGQVVGFTLTNSAKGFVWDSKSGYANLNDLVDTPGWNVISANSINRDGVIAGFGVHNGRKRAVLLIPVAKPDLSATP